MAAAASLYFPRSRRLRTATEFDRIQRDGTAWRGKFMTLQALAVEGGGPFRAGFVVSRRLGGAVLRNRVRRRLREIVRKNQRAVRPDLWLVVIARRHAAKASYRALEDEWLRLAGRASILL